MGAASTAKFVIQTSTRMLHSCLSIAGMNIILACMEDDKLICIFLCRSENILNQVYGEDNLPLQCMDVLNQMQSHIHDHVPRGKMEAFQTVAHIHHQHKISLLQSEYL